MLLLICIYFFFLALTLYHWSINKTYDRSMDYEINSYYYLNIYCSNGFYTYDV